MSAPVRPEPGFDFHAPCIPQARRGRMSVWLVAALALAIAAGAGFTLFRYLDRPALSDMRGTIHERWTATYSLGLHREADLATGEGR